VKADKVTRECIVPQHTGIKTAKQDTYIIVLRQVVPSPTKPMFLRLFHSNSSSYLYGTEWTQQRTSELYNDELCFGHDVIDGLLADSGHRGLWSIDLH
jgi:hypothetical protein